jgi:transposase
VTASGWRAGSGLATYVIHTSSVAVSREHRRAKTDRLDTELLQRAFLGWLRGERDHCKMVAIPTIKDEGGKRPNGERESLVGEQSRIINRIKAALVRLGIRSFNPKLKKAAERLEGLRTPEGEPIPHNTLSELYRDMERRRLVRDQIRQIESARLDRLEQAPGEGAHAMARLLARVMGIGVETADMLVQEVLSRELARSTCRSALCGPHSARKGWRDPGNPQSTSAGQRKRKEGHGTRIYFSCCGIFRIGFRSSGDSFDELGQSAAQ